MAERDDLIYLASVVDLLGNIGVRHLPNGTTVPLLSVQHARLNEDVMRLMRDLTGVRPMQVTRDYHRTPCSEHCEQPHQHVVSEHYRWSVVGSKATIILHTLLPLLRIQQDRAHEVIQVGLDAPGKPKVRNDFVARGWSDPWAASPLHREESA